MTRHFHGTPVWGGAGNVLKVAVRDSGAFVSYARPDQIKQCFTYANSVGLDCGAFSAWKRGLFIDWTKYYQFISAWYGHDKLKFFCIPDVIEGGEEDNDLLIKKLPTAFRDKAAPVWHLHESIDRLKRLTSTWERVCLGSSGQYAAIRTKHWHVRMHEAFVAIRDENPGIHVHGLRMLDGRVFGNYPLTTADSTNLACNVPKTEVKYPELTSQLRAIGCTEEEVLAGRCAILRKTIEMVHPPTLAEYFERYEAKRSPQMSLEF